MSLLKHKYLKLLIGLTVLLVLGPTVYFRLLRPGKTAAAWWNDYWIYRQAVNITNGSGSDLTDFQVSINIGTSALIAAGKMQSDCGDVRITDVNGKPLPYWVETAVNTCNNSSNSTYIWTKIPSIPTTGTTIYFYYGNSSATNGENGSQVFYFFDGFDGSALDSKWTTIFSDSISVSSSYLEIDRTSSSTTVAASYTPLAESVIEFRGIQVMETPSFRNRLYFGTLSGTTFIQSRPNSVDYGLFYDGVNAPCEVYHNGWQNVMLDTTSLFSIKHILHGSVVDSYYRNQSTATAIYSVTGLTPDIANSSVNALALSVTEQNTSHFKIDTVFVRKYASTEPTTSNSSEEVGAGPIAYWKFDEGYGATTSDSSSSRNNGTITGAVWKSEDLCVSGKCLYFDGSADNVSISSSITLSPNSGFTFSHWLRTTSTGGQVYTLGNTGGASGYRFGIDAGRVAFLIGNASVYSEKTCGTTTVNDNKWHLITGVFGSASFTCYIDGRLEATVAYDVGEDYTGMSTSAPGIGAPPCCTDFQGFLDDVKIYPYQRTTAQVKSDYNAGKKGMGSSKGSSVNLGGNKDNSDALSNGLVGYWKMDENTGTTTADTSGNGNTGTLGTGNSAPGWSPGMYGVGLSFDGSNDYVSITGFGNSAPTDDITISLWIKTSTKQQSAFMFNPDSNSNRINFHPCYINGITYWDFGDIATGGRLSYSNPSHCSSPSWQHYTLVSSHTDNYMAIYRNGIREAYGNSHGHFSRTNTDLWIGGIKDYSLNGSLDEVRIYDRALSPVEVQQLYNWAPGPVGYWKMEEGSGATTNDSSTFANTGVVGTGVSAPTWATGKYGKGLHFDGSGSKDVLTVTDNSGLGPPTMTVEAWVYPTAFVSGASIYNRRDSSNVGGTTLELSGTGGSVICYYYISSAWRSAATTATLSLNRWNHVSCTYDGSTIVLYINGVKDATTTSIAGTVNNPASPSVAIGRNIASNTYSWDGTIDEVKIYNYARSVKQVVEDMNAGHPAVGSPIGSQMAYYKFDEGYSTNANDSASHTYTGTIATPIWSNDGIYNKALGFDGTNSNLALPAALGTVANFGGAEGVVTFSMWLYVETDNTQVTIMHNLGGAWAYFGLNASSVFQGMVWNCTTSANYWPTSTSPIPLNTWTHVVSEFSGEGYKFYINGKLDKSVSDSDVCLNKASTPHFGLDNVGWSNFTGKIDELKVYNYALTADEVKLEYNHGSALVLGSTSVNTGNTAPATAGSQEYCVPGDTAACSLPVAEWKMEEGSGTSAYDSSTYSNTGTLGTGNSAPTWTTGKYGKGLSFDGSHSFVNVGSSSSLNPGNDITLSAWVYWNGGTGDRNIVTKENAYEFRVNGGYINYAINPWAWRGGTDAPISQNKWQYVVITNDSDGLQKIYIDGVEKHSESSGGAITSNSDVVTIGARFAGAGSFFSGFIDEVKIYNYVRTPAQIAWDYNRGGPILWYKFDDCQGTTLYDSTGLNNNATISIGNSSPQTSAGSCGVGDTTAWYNGRNGKFNSSLNFDGGDDYAYKATTTQSVDGVNESACVWVKHTASNWILALGNGGWDRRLHTSYWVMTDKSANYYYPLVPGNDDGNWRHLCYTVSSKVLKSYVDGRLTYTATMADDLNPRTLTPYLGGKICSGAVCTYYYTGQLDDLRVFNYALTPDQIKMIYNEGGAVRFGPITGTP